MVLHCWLQRAGCISQDTYLLYVDTMNWITMLIMMIIWSSESFYLLIREWFRCFSAQCPTGRMDKELLVAELQKRRRICDFQKLWPYLWSKQSSLRLFYLAIHRRLWPKIGSFWTKKRATHGRLFNLPKRSPLVTHECQRWSGESLVKIGCREVWSVKWK